MRRTFAVLAIALVAATGLGALAPARALAADGYTQTAASVYQLDPANGRLQVTVTLKVTNETPDRQESYPCIEYSNGWLPIPYPSTCYTTTRYAMTTTTALVENEATDLGAVSDGQPLQVSEGAPGVAYRVVTIAFPSLYVGETRTVTLTYSIRGGEPRSQSATRTMSAFVNFCAIANGVDKGNVKVRLPKGFKVTTTGETLASRVVGAERVLSSGKITATSDWFACFTGTNAGAYKTAKVAAHNGQTIIVRSWPEDPAWAKGVRADIAASLPALERLTGTGLAGEAALSVEETPTGIEYAGFYDVKSGTVTVGEDYGQPALVEHELAHVWFNQAGFRETWLSEGLAEWAGRLVSGEAPACTRPDAAAGTITLSRWQTLSALSTPAERDAARRQYDAACYVVTAVADAAGDEGMTSALSALLARRDPYRVEDDARRANPAATWRDWLDAVDELALAPAGASDTLASDLLVAYGVATDTALLAQRSTTRRAYRDLVATTEGWVVPAAVRSPMATWDFRTAAAAIDAAGPTWTLTGETDALLAGVDARHGPAAEAWAAATSLEELEAAADLAARQLAAARDLGAARDLLDAPLDIAQQVGLFGTQVPSIDAAIPAVRAGDGDTVAAITAEIRATVAGLRAVGQQRMVGGAVLSVLLVALLAVLFVRQARAASLRRASAGPETMLAVAQARARPQPWVSNALDDSPTEVWNVLILTSDPDPDLGALVRRRPPIVPRSADATAADPAAAGPAAAGPASAGPAPAGPAPADPAAADEPG